MRSQGLTEMRKPNQQKAQPTVIRNLLIIMLGSVSLLAAGCDSERGEKDGELINAIVLPTDVVLNLACEDVGIHPERNACFAAHCARDLIEQKQLALRVDIEH